MYPDVPLRNYSLTHSLCHSLTCDKTAELSTAVWLGGRVVRTLDLRSIGRGFESWPLRYRVQSWANC